jgi:hypothetical protein
MVNEDHQSFHERYLMEQIKVVLRYKDGKVVKGYSQDFNPTRPSFHFQKEPQDALGNQPMLIDMKVLKAVFFVKSFEGNKDYKKRKEFIQSDRSQGRKVEVTFIDNEVIQGSTVGYDPQRLGFFLFPADSGSNNIRIFVLSTAVKNFRFL